MPCQYGDEVRVTYDVEVHVVFKQVLVASDDVLVLDGTHAHDLGRESANLGVVLPRVLRDERLGHELHRNLAPIV